jgi:hypothetical protein
MLTKVSIALVAMDKVGKIGKIGKMTIKMGIPIVVVAAVVVLLHIL